MTAEYLFEYTCYKVIIFSMSTFEISGLKCI